MEVIASFQVDHTNLKPGIYVSRQDDTFTTYDIRMTAPNREPAVNPAAMHTIEHLVATYLRNHELWKERIVYWGPMGCMTGSYLIIKGSAAMEEMRRLMTDAFQFVADYAGEVPGTTPATCGNYLMHDLPMAKWEARRYVDRLMNDFHCEYQNIERPDAGGMSFHDA